MWNDRYSRVDYAYGTQPNEFFKNQLITIPSGNILLPAEGEGRNAVYAARQGWNVNAFDSSSVAKKKADKLAHLNKVALNYQVASFDTFTFDKNSFDAIALIYAHTPKENRQKNHRKLLNYLKPNGKLILEGFSKNQINYNSGGPKNIDMLFSIDELKEDFKLLKIINIREEIIFLNEGDGHFGKAAVIRFVGEKQ